MIGFLSKIFGIAKEAVTVDHRLIKEGDYVSSRLGHFKNKRVIKVEKYRGSSEGNAITVEGKDSKYWSKYLFKV